MSLSRVALERLVRDLAGRSSQWQHLVRHTARARVYHELLSNDYANAWLICWSEDHDTGWHDHDDSAAAIFVAEGMVREERLRMTGEPSKRVLGAGATFFVPPSAIHRVRHAGWIPAVTVHAYSPPLRRTGSYTVASDGELQRAGRPSEYELRANPVLI